MPRLLLTGCVAMTVGASALALAAVASPASAAGNAAEQPPSGPPPVSLAITSVSPQYATPGNVVTVTGTITNDSARAIPGLSIQLRSSMTPFGNRNDLQEYVDGTLPEADEPVPGAVTALRRALAPRATATWSADLAVNSVPISVFGVYPLAAQAENASLTALTVDRTFLPFWPGKAQDPKPEQIAWVWPLIDQPRQAVCRGLLNDGLEASLASGGRLGDLLQAGSRFATTAHLTWAIDPALLSNVDTMTKPYTVTTPGAVSAGQCGGTAKPASQAAVSWLDQLKSAITGEPVLLTPYGDADIAALTRYGMNADLTRAFAEGRKAASSILGRTFAATAPASSTNLAGMAWPADGIADYAVLENLAASDGINTVVLDSSTMQPSPPQDYTPSAQTTTPDGVGPPLKVLLSDDTITQILASGDSPSDSPATAFAVAQRYLAETAMIDAEQPNLPRSLVVAPPRRWDPPAGLASELLQETVSAPWLKPVSLGQLAAAKNPSGVVPRDPPRAHSKAQLSRSLLNQARQVDQQARLLMSVEQHPDLALSGAAAAIESAAWRGGGSAGAQGAALASEISGYLRSQESGLKIIRVPRVTLGGLKGTVTVSISNGLSYAVDVRLQALTGTGVTAAPPQHAVLVPPGQQEVVKVAVAASTVGSTTLRLRLLTPQGMPFPAQASMTVQATNYGTLALVIIAGALGVFVLTAATRAIRRGRRRRGGPRDGASSADAGRADAEAEGGEGGQRGQQAAGQPARDQAAGPDQRGEPDGADNVMADGLGMGRHVSDPAGQHASAHEPAEDTDDYAWAPGRADLR
jgi:Family of unknown function (DUF6049)